MEVDAAEFAAFQAHKATEVERAAQRIAENWVRWADEVGGDVQNILRAHDMARDLMREHGVDGWTLKFGNARKQDGGITYRYARGTKTWDGKPGTLTLSAPLMSLWTEEQQREVILHEIAHCCVPDDAHGPWWGWHCHRLGIEPRPTWGLEEILRASTAARRAPKRRNTE